MPKPVLHRPDVHARLQMPRGERRPEFMQPPLGLIQLRSLRDPLHRLKMLVVGPSRSSGKDEDTRLATDLLPRTARG